MKTILLITALFCFISLQGQDSPTDPREGELLYNNFKITFPDTVRCIVLVTKCYNCAAMPLQILYNTKTYERFYYKKHWLWNKKTLTKVPRNWILWSRIGY